MKRKKILFFVKGVVEYHFTFLALVCV